MKETQSQKVNKFLQHCEGLKLFIKEAFCVEKATFYSMNNTAIQFKLEDVKRGIFYVSVSREPQKLKQEKGGKI